MNYKQKAQLSNEAVNEKLEMAVEQITQQGLSYEIEALQITSVYMDYGKNAAAIKTLEELLSSNIKTADIYLALGDIYRNEGSNISAKENYEKAIELAGVSDDLIRVAAKAALSSIELELKNEQKANDLFQEARVKFEVLGKENQLLKFNGLAEFFSQPARCRECVDPTNGLCGRWVGTGINRHCQAYDDG